MLVDIVFKDAAGDYIKSIIPFITTVERTEALVKVLDLDKYTKEEIEDNISDVLDEYYKATNEMSYVVEIEDSMTGNVICKLVSNAQNINFIVEPNLSNEEVEELRNIYKMVYSNFQQTLYAAQCTAALREGLNNMLNKPTKAGNPNKSNTVENGDASEEQVLETVSKMAKVDIVKPKETLNDYVCNDILKNELEEIKDFFENETAYVNAGIALPKGILFKGAPGTGKTYAAKCIAGSTNCYFMSCTASALQGMYIGSGAENIRNLFNGAKLLREKLNKGVIVFIDEIDSFGSRESHNGSSSGEEDRTLNQLLAEMSGFEDTTGIMVLAATNYPERLDDALMRSGRFSRQITINYPEKDERLNLVHYYFGKLKLPLNNTNEMEITEITENLSPADIKEVSNEAGIMAVRSKNADISLDMINEAVNKVITKNIKTPDKSTEFVQTVTAHEIGHVVAELIYSGKCPIKVTNYCYGDAGGFTQPSQKNHGLKTYEDLINEVKQLLGGRAAEEVLCGTITTGASSDLEKAKKIIVACYKYYNFEEYDPEKLESLVIKKLSEIYKNVVEDFKLDDNLNLLNELVNHLSQKRTLYTKDILAIYNRGGIL